MNKLLPHCLQVMQDTFLFPPQQGTLPWLRLVWHRKEEEESNVWNFLGKFLNAAINKRQPTALLTPPYIMGMHESKKPQYFNYFLCISIIYHNTSLSLTPKTLSFNQLWRKGEEEVIPTLVWSSHFLRLHRERRFFQVLWSLFHLHSKNFVCGRGDCIVECECESDSVFTSWLHLDLEKGRRMVGN